MLTAIPQKTVNLTIVYGIVAILSLILMVCYLRWEKKKETPFSLLYIFVAAANCGYFLQSVADTLMGAMWANRVSYFGSAYLVLVMLMIIMEVCHQKPGKGIKTVLICISTVAFLLAASGDWLGLYYKTVDITEINGMTKLIKEYGPLHTIYPVYLLSYLVMMIAVIIRSLRKKMLTSPKYAIFLVAVVLLNLGVWAVEQIVYVDFEFLSISYIATEIILLLIYSFLRDYGIVQSGGVLLSAQMLSRLQQREKTEEHLPPGMEELLKNFVKRTETLSAAEKRIFNYYVEGYEAADIPDIEFISINTVKKHNRSIYQKLEVASRDELMLFIELFRCCGRLDELTSEREAI